MDIDQNDLLNSNIYIPTPNLHPQISQQSNEEFKKYYESEQQKKYNSKIKSKNLLLENLDLNESNDSNNILNNNNINNLHNKHQENDNNRIIREIDTLVSIDSRDRIKANNPNANDFTIFLGKTFRNIKKIELVKIEFPNTDAVINSGNNRIYWRNQEDIDLDVTVTVKGVVQYPIYSAILSIGSYTVTTLQTEIINECNLIKRQQGLLNGNPSNNFSDYHFFVVTLNINTDIVSFTSLIMTNLGNNSFATTISTGVIIVTLANHGYANNSTVYIYGCKTLSGIPASTLNGFQIINVINSNQFTFTVNVNASSTVTGGGNTLQCGIPAPFQLLWGDYSNTIAQNIGYPLENSSETINTQIVSLQNIYQMIITTTTNMNFLSNYNYIGQLVNIGYILSNNFNSISSNLLITSILSTNSILVQVSDNNVYQSLSVNSQATTLQFGSQTFVISSFSPYLINSFLITTSTNHNYVLNDINNNNTITLVGTSDSFIPNDPNYDGTYTINQLPSLTTIIVPGVIGTLNNHTNGYGTIPRQNPLTTWTVPISSIIPNYILSGNLYYSLFSTTVPHNLQPGDSVQFFNIVSVPPLISNYTITAVPTPYTFNVQFNFGSLDQVNIQQGLAYIGTGLITVSFPSHGFNSILSISNGISIPVTSTTITNTDGSISTVNVTLGDTTTQIYVTSTSTGTALSGTTQAINIQTTNAHNLSIGQIVRITFSGIQPVMGNTSLTGGGYIVYDILGQDIFSIINKTNAFQLLTSIPSNLNGIMGLSNSFYLYDVTTIGGINESLINGISFDVRTIIDVNTFTFMGSFYANTIEQGGGSSIYISSLLHGFNGIQTNTKNNLLNRSINLEGENYAFLTCPQLDTMLNTGTVLNVFARISLDQSPGYICFTFLSNPKIYYTVPLDILEQLQFSVYNYNGTLYSFNDLDYSFCLKITESVDSTKLFNISSRRGITDTS